MFFGIAHYPSRYVLIALDLSFFSGVSLQTIMDRKPGADDPHQPTTAIPGNNELQEIKQQLASIRNDLNNTQSLPAVV